MPVLPSGVKWVKRVKRVKWVKPRNPWVLPTLSPILLKGTKVLLQLRGVQLERDLDTHRSDESVPDAHDCLQPQRRRLGPLAPRQGRIGGDGGVNRAIIF